MGIPEPFFILQQFFLKGRIAFDVMMVEFIRVSRGDVGPVERQIRYRNHADIGPFNTGIVQHRHILMTLADIIGGNLIAHPLSFFASCRSLCFKNGQVPGRHGENPVDIRCRIRIILVPEHPALRNSSGTDQPAEGIDHGIFQEVTAIEDSLFFLLTDVFGITELFIPKAFFALIRTAAHQYGRVRTADSDMPECFPVTGRHESRIKENDRVRPFDPVFGIIPVIEHIGYRSQLFRRHRIEFLRGVIENGLGNSGKGRTSGHTPLQGA